MLWVNWPLDLAAIAGGCFFVCLFVAVTERGKFQIYGVLLLQAAEICNLYFRFDVCQRREIVRNAQFVDLCGACEINLYSADLCGHVKLACIL
jgi:hypothetical protein